MSVAGSGYSVHPSGLTAGSKQIAELQSECTKLASSVTEAFSALAAGVGNAGVSSAAEGAGATALQRFLDANAGFEHTVQELTSTASTYAKAESNAASSTNGIGPGRAR
jgi:hypothetical protein